MTGTAPLLEVEDLEVAFGRRGSRSGQRVLHGVGLTVRPGEILGVVGETGSGKTTLARAVVGLSPVVGGAVRVDGEPVHRLRGRALRAYRRSGRVQYLHQDPLRALDPDLTVRRLVAEPLAVAGVPAAERRERADEALRLTGLDPELLGERLPGRLSGGQRQRVLLARAVVTRPRLLLADEPVSALDASSRNHVLRLLDGLRRELDAGLVVISHDLSSLAGIADRLAVLYRGRIVEQGPAAEVLARPAHPYTALLTASAPRVRDRSGPGPELLRRTAEPLPWAAGPDPEGCSYAARCPFATDACRTVPPVAGPDDGRRTACHHTDTWPDTLAVAAGATAASAAAAPAGAGVAAGYQPTAVPAAAALRAER